MTLGGARRADQDPFYRVSATAMSVWAKSLEQGQAWMPLPRHLGDTAAVAEILWDEWLPAGVRQRVALDVHVAGSDDAETADVARRLAVFLAGTHDIGKCAPCFAQKMTPLAERMASRGLSAGRLSASEMSDVPHSIVSCMQLADYLEAQGLAFEAALSIAVVPGGHHGTFPSEQALGAGAPGRRATGQKPVWERTRVELVVAAAEFAGLDTFDWSRWRGSLGQPAQLILTGLVVTADWLASNVDLFPFDGAEKSRVRARAAMDELALAAPWRAKAPDDDPELFVSRFALPSDARPRPVQAAAMELARGLARPELLLIEAPTGEGKTEAALGCAEIFATRFGAGGVQVALPTRATSDGMFPRILEWLGRVIPRGESASAVLSHGSAQFNEDFRALLRVGRVAEIHDDNADTGEVRAHWWLMGRKTSALADFVVGTIDQVLMAGLVSRHVCLRHLGLAGKVLILDEVHAADTYMSVYLDRVLEWCGATGVPVIALSATLPPARRAALVEAYARGRGDSDAADRGEVAAEARSYPLLSTSGDAGPRAVPASDRRRRIQVEFLDEDPAGLVDRVVLEVADGGCLAVICNTVSRAQALYADLEPRLGGDVVLLHSRFLAVDRLTIERRLRAVLGKDAGPNRPERLVVVATQVIEQSLDIDFDLMVSDLAPVDLVVQRAGRLHRHERLASERPEAMQEARLILTGESQGDGPPRFPRGCERVYGRAALLRSSWVLHQHLRRDGVMVSPDDVADLVRDAYDEELVPDESWSAVWSEAEQRRHDTEEQLVKSAAMFCVPRPGDGPVLGFTSGSVPDDDLTAQAAVRDSDDSLEVVVVVRRDGQLRTVPWLEGHPDEPVDLGTEPPPELARAVAQCTVRLPSYLSAGSRALPVVEELERDGIETWQSSRWLRGVLPLVLDDEYTRTIPGFRLTYDRHRGLLVEKEKQE